MMQVTADSWERTPVTYRSRKALWTEWIQNVLRGSEKVFLNDALKETKLMEKCRARVLLVLDVIGGFRQIALVSI